MRLLYLCSLLLLTLAWSQEQERYVFHPSTTTRPNFLITSLASPITNRPFNGQLTQLLEPGLPEAPVSTTTQIPLLPIAPFLPSSPGSRPQGTAETTTQESQTPQPFLPSVTINTPIAPPKENLLACHLRSCSQEISGRNLPYARALEIVQQEEYLDVADLEIIRRKIFRYVRHRYRRQTGPGCTALCVTNVLPIGTTCASCTNNCLKYPGCCGCCSFVCTVTTATTTTTTTTTAAGTQQASATLLPVLPMNPLSAVMAGALFWVLGLVMAASPQGLTGGIQGAQNQGQGQTQAQLQFQTPAQFQNGQPPDVNNGAFLGEDTQSLGHIRGQPQIQQQFLSQNGQSSVNFPGQAAQGQGQPQLQFPAQGQFQNGQSPVNNVAFPSQRFGGGLPIASTDLAAEALSLVPDGLQAVAIFPPFATPRTTDGVVAVIFRENDARRVKRDLDTTSSWSSAIRETFRGFFSFFIRFVN